MLRRAPSPVVQRGSPEKVDPMMRKQAIHVHGKTYPLVVHALCSATNKRKFKKTGVHRKDVMAFVVNRQGNEAECLARHVDGMHHELLAHGRVEITSVRAKVRYSGEDTTCGVARAGDGRDFAEP